MRLTCGGSFYGLLAERSAVCRDDAKRRFLVDVLAKKGRYPSPVEDAFRAWFPNLWLFVNQINRDDHGTLIRALQRLESWLVVECVAPLLVGRIPIVTLHDAVYCRCEDLPALEAGFMEAFDRIGFWPSVKKEFW